MEDIPCDQPISAGVVRHRPHLTNKLFIDPESKSEVCVNPNVTQVIELCTTYVNETDPGPLSTMTLCGSIYFLFKAKLSVPHDLDLVSPTRPSSCPTTVTVFPATTLSTLHLNPTPDSSPMPPTPGHGMHIMLWL